MVLWKKLQKPKRFPPGPPALPLIGSAPFIGKSTLKGKRLQDYLAEKYGDIVGIYGGRDPMVFLSNAETVRTLFKSDQVTLRPKNSPFHELRYGDEDGPRGGVPRRDQPDSKVGTVFCDPVEAGLPSGRLVWKAVHVAKHLPSGSCQACVQFTRMRQKRRRRDHA